MADDGTCQRCGHQLGSNASACWWCEWYVRSLKRRALLPVLLVAVVGCGVEPPPSPPTIPNNWPNLAEARTMDDVRAWMGEPCERRKNHALPLGEDWLYCVERVETPPPEWRLSPACVPGCSALVVHFAVDRYVGETPPGP